MNTGSDAVSVHLIEEVTFDFSFDSTAVSHDHDANITRLVVDSLLPVIDRVLDEHDEAGKVLRIDRLAVDLGDIPIADYSAVISDLLREKLIVQLHNAMAGNKKTLPSALQLTQQTSSQPLSLSVSGLIVQRMSAAQSELEKLQNFLLCGNMPWYVNTSDSEAHVRMLDLVLQEARLTGDLITFLAQMTSTQRVILLRRLVNQFPSHALEKMLVQIAPAHHNLLMDLITAFQIILPTMPLSTAQQANGVKQLWEQIFDKFIENAHLQNLYFFQHLSDVIPDILQPVLAPLSQETHHVIYKLIDAAKKNTNNHRLIGILLQTADKRVESPADIANNYASTYTAFNETKPASKTKQKALTGITELKHSQGFLTAFPKILQKLLAPMAPLNRFLFNKWADTDNNNKLRGNLTDIADQRHASSRSVNVVKNSDGAATTEAGYAMGNEQQALLNPSKADIEYAKDTTYYSVTPPVNTLPGRFVPQAYISHLFQRIFLAMRQAEPNGFKLSFDGSGLVNIWAIQKQLFKSLQDAPKRSQFIAWLPGPVLLDITYVLNPQVAIVLEQLMAHAKVLYQQTITEQTMTFFEWQQQLWQNALRYVATVSAQDSQIMSEQPSLYTSDFVLALMQGLSNNLDHRSILQTWHAALFKEQQQSKGTIVLQNILAEYMSQTESQDINQAILTREAVQQSIAAMAEDFTAQQQRLKTALNTGALARNKLASPELKLLLHALLKHDPALPDTNVQAFIDAIERYAGQAKNRSVYYQQILEKVLSGQMVDLEVIASQPAQANAVLQTEVISEVRTTKPTSPTVVALYADDQAVLTREAVQQSIAAMTEGFTAQQQRLKTALHTGALARSKLAAPDLKLLVHALLKHDPALPDTNVQVFIDAIERYAGQAKNRSAYYQQILEKVLSGQMVDLEIIASQPAQADAVRQLEAVSAIPHAQPMDAIITVFLRIQTALQQAGVNEMTHLPTFDKPAIQRYLLENLQNTSRRTQLIARLPQAILLDIFYLLLPQIAIVHEQFLVHAKILSQQATSQSSGSIKEWRQQLWEHALNYVASRSTRRSQAISLELMEFVQSLMQGLYNREDHADILQSWCEMLQRESGTQILQHIFQSLIFLYQTDAAAEKPCLAKLSTVSIDDQTAAMAYQFSERELVDKLGGEFYIYNAGQVLAAPYFPRLFNMLGLTKKGTFTDRQAAERAVHLLQFMVNEQTQSPEHQLLLNKILCGLSIEIPVCSRIELSEHERDTIEDLIRGMIQNWKTIGKTSINGLRGSFLQRKGKLLLRDDGMWHLTIEPGPFDMLLDRLPWRFAIIKHMWMDRAVHVTWR